MKTKVKLPPEVEAIAERVDNSYMALRKLVSEAIPNNYEKTIALNVLKNSAKWAQRALIESRPRN